LVDVPTYAFAETRFWQGTPFVAENANAEHPLLGPRRESPDGSSSYVIQLSPDTLGYLRDHQVLGQLALPAPAYADMGTWIARERFGESACEVRQLTIEAMLTIDRQIELQTIVKEAASELTVEVFSRRDNGIFTRHASMTLGRRSDRSEKTEA